MASKQVVFPVAFLCLVTAGVSAEQDLPYQSSDLHLGVASCANSTCHGAASVLQGTNVQQNEYLVWQRDDPHATALRVLYNDQSRDIAERLGIGPPERADLCLDCHTDHPPSGARGPRFQQSDGIGCEACHGGAEGWLDSHRMPDRSHAENVADGLYPTADTAARARLCLSCHLGNEDKPMTHELLGAGHPPLLFELDTFAAILPTHYSYDEDYLARKPLATGPQAWSIGQAETARMMLAGLLADDRVSSSRFPDFAFYKCEACHHAIYGTNYREESRLGTKAGYPPLADASLRMLLIINEQLEATSSQTALQQFRNLHSAATVGKHDLANAVNAFSAAIDTIKTKASTHDFTKQDVTELLVRLSDPNGILGKYRNHGEAEQTAMALALLLDFAVREELYSAAQISAVEGVLDKIFGRLEDRGKYRPDAFLWSLAEFNKLIRNNR